MPRLLSRWVPFSPGHVWYLRQQWIWIIVLSETFAWSAFLSTGGTLIDMDSSTLSVMVTETIKNNIESCLTERTARVRRYTFFGLMGKDIDQICNPRRFPSCNGFPVRRMRARMERTRQDISKVSHSCPRWRCYWASGSAGLISSSKHADQCGMWRHHNLQCLDRYCSTRRQSWRDASVARLVWMQCMCITCMCARVTAHRHRVFLPVFKKSTPVCSLIDAQSLHWEALAPKRHTPKTKIRAMDGSTIFVRVLGVFICAWQHS